MPLSTAEIKKIAASLGMTQAQVSSYYSYLLASVGGQTPAISQSARNHILKALRGKISQKQKAYAAELAERAADSLTDHLSKAQLNTMGAALEQGLDLGLHPDDIARDLTQVSELDQNRQKSLSKYDRYLEAKGYPPGSEEFNKKHDKRKERLVRSRRRTIAQNEANEIVSQSREKEAEDRGAKWKMWQSVGDDRVGEDHLENEAVGLIEIDKAFPSGDMRPPGRPNCRCTVAYISSDIAKAAIEKKKGKEMVEPEPEIPVTEFRKMTDSEGIDFVRKKDWKVDDALGRAMDEGLISDSEFMEMQAAQFDYTSSGYKDINNALREGKSNRQADLMLKHYEVLPEETSLEENLKAYRGVNTTHPLAKELASGKDVAGAIFKDDGFTSVSVSEDRASMFADDEGEGGVLFYLDLPEGTKHLPGFSAESELVLPPGKQIRIDEVIWDDKNKHYMAKCSILNPEEVR